MHVNKCFLFLKKSTRVKQNNNRRINLPCIALSLEIIFLFFYFTFQNLKRSDVGQKEVPTYLTHPEKKIFDSMSKEKAGNEENEGNVGKGVQVGIGRQAGKGVQVGKWEAPIQFELEDATIKEEMSLKA
jgi:hypothetical protein